MLRRFELRKKALHSPSDIKKRQGVVRVLSNSIRTHLAAAKRGRNTPVQQLLIEYMPLTTAMLLDVL